MSKFHFSYLNGSPNIDPVSGISPNNYWATANGGNIYDQIRRRLGYRFVLISSNVNNNTLTVNLRNDGFGNLFNPRKAYLVLEETGVGTPNPAPVYQVELNGGYNDPRRWDAGVTIAITQNLVNMTSTTGPIPKNKTYKLYLNLPDSSASLASDKRYSVRFANNNSGVNVFWDETTNGKGWNNLFRSTFLSTGNTASRMSQDGQGDIAFDARTYPNPFNNSFKLGINTSDEEAISVQVYDMIGRLIDLKQISVTDIENTELGSNYPAGVYNVVLMQGENIKKLRIIKQ